MMYRSKIGRSFYYGGVFSSLIIRNPTPHDTLEYPPEKKTKIGIDGVMDIFRETSPGKVSEELVSIIQLGWGSFLLGYVIGGWKSSSNSYDNFVIANQHTKFVSPYEAKRKLQDTIMLSFMRNGVKWGLKVAAFTVVYSFIITAVPIFKGSDGFIEYPIGGALAGSFARIYLGFKGMLGGAVIGCAFGLPHGLLVFLSSKLMGVTMSDVRKLQYNLYEWRSNCLKEINKKIVKSAIDDPASAHLDLHSKRMSSLNESGYEEDEQVFVAIPSAGNEMSHSVANIHEMIQPKT